MHRNAQLWAAVMVHVFAAGAALAGTPDFSGLWTNASITTLERPAVFRVLELSEAEALAYEKAHPGTPEPTRGDAVGQDETEWWEMGAKLARLGGRARSSWIVEPLDGLLPYSADGLAALKASQMKARSFDDPEARPAAERCLMGLHGSSLPPMMNTSYNNHLQIVQTGDHLVIVPAMSAGPRIVHLRAAAAPPGGAWSGHSVGRWEGQTLVVETTGFHPQAQWRAPGRLFISSGAKVTERFTQTTADELLYQFQVDDPAIYSRIWKGEMPLRRVAGPMFEFACHEGNYSLPGILAGARKVERDAAAAH